MTIKVSQEARDAAADMAVALELSYLGDGGYFGCLFATKLQSLIDSTIERCAVALDGRAKAAKLLVEKEATDARVGVMVSFEVAASLVRNLTTGD